MGLQSYSYYPRSHVVRNNKCEAAALGRSRLFPSIKGLDYLVLRHRVEIIWHWISSLPNVPLMVLDVGGRIQPYRPLFPHISSYVAVDLVLEGLVDVVADADSLPLKDCTFDVVMCTQVLSYVSHPRRVLAECHRVLKPRGTIILSAPTFFPQYHDERWRFTPTGLLELMHEFEGIEVIPECHSAAGIARSINHLMHSNIESYRLRRLASLTSIPTINAIGMLLERLESKDERCAANYSVRAVKP